MTAAARVHRIFSPVHYRCHKDPQPVDGSSRVAHCDGNIYLHWYGKARALLDTRQVVPDLVLYGSMRS